MFFSPYLLTNSCIFLSFLPTVLLHPLKTPLGVDNALSAEHGGRATKATISATKLLGDRLLDVDPTGVRIHEPGKQLDFQPSTGRP